MIRHLDTFAGIGGFSLAAEWTGAIEPAGFVEINPWCRRVLAKHWPGVPQHDDIKTLAGSALERFGRIDLITGGYPCQPFSLAGQRRGADDPRHLWPHLRTVIDQARPRFLLLENVAGHISMGLDVVLADLEADGYTCGAVVVPAGAVNALHRRDRVWIMAYAERSESQSGPVLDQVRRWAGEAEQVGMGGGRTAVADSAGVGEREPADQADTLAVGRDARQVLGSRGGNATLADTGCARSARAENKIRPRRHAADVGGADVANADEVGRGAGINVVREGKSDAEGGGDLGHTDEPSFQSRLVGGECAGEWPAWTPGGESIERDGGEAQRCVDIKPDGLPERLVRRPAAGPDAIRDRWADGSWEDGLPRVVTTEPDRKHKLMAAGNAIVPLVAYEILRVMVGGAA